MATPVPEEPPAGRRYQSARDSTAKVVDGLIWELLRPCKSVDLGLLNDYSAQVNQSLGKDTSLGLRPVEMKRGDKRR
jgi:hypothetical protein